MRLLLKAGTSCYHAKRKGERKRKSVRGCIVGHDIATLALVVVKKGANDIPGISDDPRSRRLGPKRAQKIRKLFNLDTHAEKSAKADEKDDVRRYVVRREYEKNGRKRYKAPKI